MKYRGGSDHGNDRDCAKNEKRDADDGISAVLRLAGLRIIVKQRGEQRHKAGSQDPADQEFIHRVGCIVGSIKCVSESCLIDDHPENDDSGKSRNAREGSASGNNEIGSTKARHVYSS